MIEVLSRLPPPSGETTMGDMDEYYEMGARLAEMAREQVELDKAWAALLIAEKAKTARAEQALEKVRQDERERCAKIAETTFVGDTLAPSARIAAAIRGDDNGLE